MHWRQVLSALMAIVVVSGPLVFAGASAETVDLGAVRFLSDVSEIATAANGSMIVTFSHGGIAVFRSADLEPLYTYYATTELNDIAVHPTLPIVAFSDNLGNVSILNLTTNRVDGTSPPGLAWFELAWAPDGSYLAGQFSAQAIEERNAIRIINPDLTTSATFASNGTVPFTYAWIHFDGKLGLFYRGYGSTCVFQPLISAPQTFECDLAANPQILEWSASDQGALVGIAGGDGVNPGMLFSGASPTGAMEPVTAFLDTSQRHLSMEPASGSYATWGGGAKVTMWKASDLPYVDFVVDGAEPSRATTNLVWVNESAIALTTTSGAIQLYHIRADPTPLEITLTAPVNGQGITGDLTIRGTTGPGNTSGQVVIRIDEGIWLWAPSQGSWTALFDTGTLPDGAHNISAAFTDGTNYSSWATVQIQTANGRPADYRPPVVWFVMPQSGNRFVERINGIVTGSSSNSPDHRLVFVEVALDNGSWRRAIQTTSTWSFVFEGAAIPEGIHTIKARGNDGIGYSRIVSVEVLFALGPGSTFLRVSIDAPPENAVLFGAAHFSGQWTFSNQTSGWVELSLAEGPWIPIMDAGPGAGTWEWDTRIGGSNDTVWTLCVRASAANESGAPACRNFRSQASGVDLAPVIEIEEVAPSLGAAGPKLAARGSATDDFAVLAVFYRLDYGEWVIADGRENWTLSDVPLSEGRDNHTLQVMAYDGFHYSDISTTEFHGPKAGDETPTMLGLPLLWILIVFIAGAVTFFVAWRIRARSAIESRKRSR